MTPRLNEPVTDPSDMMMLLGIGKLIKLLQERWATLIRYCGVWYKRWVCVHARWEVGAGSSWSHHVYVETVGVVEVMMQVRVCRGVLAAAIHTTIILLLLWQSFCLFAQSMTTPAWVMGSYQQHYARCKRGCCICPPRLVSCRLRRWRYKELKPLFQWQRCSALEQRRSIINIYTKYVHLSARSWELF